MSIKRIIREMVHFTVESIFFMVIFSTGLAITGVLVLGAFWVMQRILG